MPGALPDAHCFGPTSADPGGAAVAKSGSQLLSQGAQELRGAAGGAAAQVPRLAPPVSSSSRV